MTYKVVKDVIADAEIDDFARCSGFRFRGSGDSAFY
jgi:hypothetical protein